MTDRAVILGERAAMLGLCLVRVYSPGRIQQWDQLNTWRFYRLGPTKKNYGGELFYHSMESLEEVESEIDVLEMQTDGGQRPATDDDLAWPAIRMKR